MIPVIYKTIIPFGLHNYYTNFSFCVRIKIEQEAELSGFSTYLQEEDDDGGDWSETQLWCTN